LSLYHAIAPDFSAVQKLSVVEIPSNFDLDSLDGKELNLALQPEIVVRMAVKPTYR
jgi:hypothetical protein